MYRSEAERSDVRRRALEQATRTLVKDCASAAALAAGALVYVTGILVGWW